MGQAEEKRARIIAQQAAREAAERAAGKLPILPTSSAKLKPTRLRRAPWSTKPKPK
jgi:hypothetical protein